MSSSTNFYKHLGMNQNLIFDKTYSSRLQMELAQDREDHGEDNVYPKRLVIINYSMKSPGWNSAWDDNETGYYNHNRYQDNRYYEDSYDSTVWQKVWGKKKLWDETNGWSDTETEGWIYQQIAELDSITIEATTADLDEGVLIGVGDKEKQGIAIEAQPTKNSLGKPLNGTLDVDLIENDNGIGYKKGILNHAIYVDGEKRELIKNKPSYSAWSDGLSFHDYDVSQGHITGVKSYILYPGTKHTNDSHIVTKSISAGATFGTYEDSVFKNEYDREYYIYHLPMYNYDGANEEGYIYSGDTSLNNNSYSQNRLAHFMVPNQQESSQGIVTFVSQALNWDKNGHRISTSNTVSTKIKTDALLSLTTEKEVGNSSGSIGGVSTISINHKKISARSMTKAEDNDQWTTNPNTYAEWYLMESQDDNTSLCMKGLKVENCGHVAGVHTNQKLTIPENNPWIETTFVSSNHNKQIDFNINHKTRLERADSITEEDFEDWYLMLASDDAKSLYIKGPKVEKYGHIIGAHSEQKLTLVGDEYIEGDFKEISQNGNTEIALNVRHKEPVYNEENDMTKLLTWSTTEVPFLKFPNFYSTSGGHVVRSSLASDQSFINLIRFRGKNLITVSQEVDKDSDMWNYNVYFSHDEISEVNDDSTFVENTDYFVRNLIKDAHTSEGGYSRIVLEKPAYDKYGHWINDKTSNTNHKIYLNFTSGDDSLESFGSTTGSNPIQYTTQYKHKHLWTKEDDPSEEGVYKPSINVPIFDYVTNIDGNLTRLVAISSESDPSSMDFVTDTYEFYHTVKITGRNSYDYDGPSAAVYYADDIENAIYYFSFPYNQSYDLSYTETVNPQKKLILKIRSHRAEIPSAFGYKNYNIKFKIQNLNFNQDGHLRTGLGFRKIEINKIDQDYYRNLLKEKFTLSLNNSGGVKALIIQKFHQNIRSLDLYYQLEGSAPARVGIEGPTSNISDLFNDYGELISEAYQAYFPEEKQYSDGTVKKIVYYQKLNEEDYNDNSIELQLNLDHFTITPQGKSYLDISLNQTLLNRIDQLEARIAELENK